MQMMSTEMAEQPAVLSRIIDRFPQLVDAVTRLAPRRQGSVVLLARGSSDNAAVFGRYVIELTTGRPVALAAPSLVTRYHVRSDYRDVLLVALSQSGQTPEITENVLALRAAGATALAITNDAASPLADAAQLVLDLEAGDELAVPATKTVTAQMLMLLAVGSALGSLRLPGLARLPLAVANLLADATAAEDLARRWADQDALLVVARGPMLAAAMETALKVRECAGVFAVAMSSGDLLHGPIASVQPGAAVLIVDGDPATDPDLQSVRRRLSDRGVDVADAWPDRGVTALTTLSPLLLPVAATVRGQQIAQALATARGTDPDSPPGLTKVTRTH